MKPLHRKSSSSLPFSASSSSLADSFASFFTDKVHKLRFSLAAISTVLPPHSPLPPVTPPQFSSFTSASESEITKILLNCPNKEADSDPIPTWLLKKCSSVLVPTFTNIVTLSLSSGQFHPILKDQLYLLSSRNPPWIKINSQTTAQSPTYLSYPKSLNVLSNLDLLNTFFLTIFSTITSYAYHKHHSTETALLYIHDHLIHAVGSQKISCLCLLTFRRLSTPLITTS